MTLTPFEFDGSEFRAIATESGSIEFVAADAARALGHRDAEKLTRSLDEDEKGTRLVGTPGGEQRLATITEAGLYKAIMLRQTGRMADDETKAMVKRFQRWVTHEVLPSIRKTGQYGLPQLEGPELMARALLEAADTIKAADARAAEAEHRAAALAIPARAWTAMVDTRGDYAVDYAAKCLSRDPNISIGRNRLFAYMAGLDWIYRHGPRNQWHAKQAQIDNGRLAQKLTTPFLNQKTGEYEVPAPTIRITPKGLAELHKRLGGTAELVTLAEVTA